MKERKLNRKPNYDYSQDGWYFVTFVTKDRKNWFGEIKNEQMCLNKFGLILKDCWSELPNHYKNCILDEYIIMPNHFHGIVEIRNPKVGTGLRPVPTFPTNINTKMATIQTQSKQHSLSHIIGSLKSFSSRKINKNINSSNVKFKWQRSFHDIIIFNDVQYNQFVRYIYNNPANHPHL